MDFILVVKVVNLKVSYLIVHFTKKGFKCIIMFNQRNQTETICHDNNPVAPVYYLLIKDYTLIDKE